MLFAGSLRAFRKPNSSRSSGIEEMASLSDSCDHGTSNERCGECDETDSEPISQDLYKKICQWAIEDGNVFLWAWVVVQWNLMVRATPTTKIEIERMMAVDDAILVHFRDCKTGIVSRKFCYANPLNPNVCYGRRARYLHQ